MQEYIIGKKDEGQRLDKFLKKYLPEAGSAFIYRMLRKKNITLNGKKASGSETVSEGDRILSFFSEETYLKMRGSKTSVKEVRKAPPDAQKIAVVYEDEDILIADKPAGILSQQADGDTYSLNDWLYEYCKEQGSLTDTFRPAVCNRLDRNTAGLSLCAKSYAGSRFLSDMIRDRNVRKIYLALAEGEMKGEAVLEGIWHKDEKSNTVSISPLREHNNIMSTNKGYVKTAYRVLKAKEGYSLLEVELFTGKSHQIRAHLASAGHPLAGDIKYGGHPYKGKRTQQLIAYRLCFPAIKGDMERLSGKVFTADGSGLLSF